MRRTPLQTLAASPTLIGAITVLVTAVAMFLSYNANQGLPFVPVYRVSLEVPNAARILPSNDVRIGGHRVGVVESIEAVPAPEERAAVEASAEEGATVPPAVARLNLKLDRSIAPLAEDSIFRVRYQSAFGLKYLEIIRGSGPGVPAGSIFDGTDDRGVCQLPENLETFSDEIPAAARNGCFQEQTELDDLVSIFDARTRNDIRAVLIEAANGLAGRGVSIGVALEELRPFLREALPVARTLSDPETELERFVVWLSRAAGAVAPVAERLAQGFTDAAVAFEALSRDPGALAATISELRPLLEESVPALRRTRPFLADTAELFRRLAPGVRELPVTLPVLNEAIEVGTPVLGRVPRAARDLHAVLAELRRAVDQPSTKAALQRLQETLDMARPLAEHVVPAQTVCNYWNYMWTFLAEHLSERSAVGFTQRNVFVQVPMGPGAVSIGGVVVDAPSTARTPLGGYSGEIADGRAGPLPDPTQEGVFEPHDLPIGHAPLYSPHGQLVPAPDAPEAMSSAERLAVEYPDCGAGQFGYPLGRLPIPRQRPADAQIGVGDYPGSMGRTTVFFNRNGERVLRDTHVASRQPPTWARVAP